MGRLFREFAVVLSVAIVVSHGRFADRHAHDVRAAAESRSTSTALLQLGPRNSSSGSSPLMPRRWRWCWITRRPVLVVMVLTIGVNVYLYIKIPKGFFPQQDTGRLKGNVMGQQHISYQAMVEKAKWFEEQVRNDPDVETVNMIAGSSGGGCRRRQHRAA